MLLPVTLWVVVVGIVDKLTLTFSLYLNKMWLKFKLTLSRVDVELSSSSVESKSYKYKANKALSAVPQAFRLSCLLYYISRLSLILENQKYSFHVYSIQTYHYLKLK